MEKYNYLIEQGFNSHVIKTILYLKILKQLKRTFFNNSSTSNYYWWFCFLETFESYLLQIYQKLNIKHWNLKISFNINQKADEKLKQASAASIIAKYSLTMTMQKEKNEKLFFQKDHQALKIS